MRLSELKPPPAVYNAVLTLRRRGVPVYRVDDDHHELSGAIVPTAWLLAEARNQGKLPVLPGPVVAVPAPAALPPVVAPAPDSREALAQLDGMIGRDFVMAEEDVVFLVSLQRRREEIGDLLFRVTADEAARLEKIATEIQP